MAVLSSVPQRPRLARAVSQLRTHRDNVSADRVVNQDAIKMASALKSGVQDLMVPVLSVIGMVIRVNRVYP